MYNLGKEKEDVSLHCCHAVVFKRIYGIDSFTLREV